MPRNSPETEITMAEQLCFYSHLLQKNHYLFKWSGVMGSIWAYNQKLTSIHVKSSSVVEMVPRNSLKYRSQGIATIPDSEFCSKGRTIQKSSVTFFLIWKHSKCKFFLLNEKIHNRI